MVVQFFKLFIFFTDDNAVIPGMGPEDKIDFTESLTADRGFIPGLDLDTSNLKDKNKEDKKVPYSKPIPRNFQAQWNDTGRPDDDDTASKEIKEVITQIVENVVPLQKMAPTAILVYGKMIPVKGMYIIYNRLSLLKSYLFLLHFYNFSWFPIGANNL